VPRLAGASLDAHDALVDLGDFELEELHEQARVRAGEHDLGALGGAGDVEHVGLEPIALAIGLGVDLLALGQDGLGPAEVDDDVALLEAAHDAGDELALAVAELVEGHLALGIADLLDDHLLGGLGGDATEHLDVHLDAQGVTELTLRIEIAGFLEEDVGLLILDLLDHGAELEQLHLAQLLVVVGFEVADHAEAAARGSLEGTLQHLHQDFAGDVLLAVYRVDQPCEITDHRGSPVRWGRRAQPGPGTRRDRG
jgi:hypothetical protein